jgi:hypothetical protein
LQATTGTITVDEQKTLWVLGWTVGGVLATAFVLNALALASI